jgi:hypothetical protein
MDGMLMSLAEGHGMQQSRLTWALIERPSKPFSLVRSGADLHREWSNVWAAELI